MNKIATLASIVVLVAVCVVLVFFMPKDLTPPVPALPAPLASTSLVALAGGCTTLNVPSSYAHLAYQDAQQVGINPDCFARHMYALSGLNPSARGQSGQVGIAQLTPQQARSLNVNPLNPMASLVAAAHLMKHYVEQYDGDYAKAMVAYECDLETVTRAEHDGGTMWLNYVPADAHAHINEVMR